MTLLLTLTAGTEDGVCAARETSSGQTILVQTGAFKRAEGASSLKAELSEKGYLAHMIAGDDFHRVAVGPFPGVKEATAAVSRLTRDGYSAYIRRDLPLQQPTRADPRESGQPPIVVDPEPVRKVETAPRFEWPRPADGESRVGALPAREPLTSWSPVPDLASQPPVLEAVLSDVRPPPFGGLGVIPAPAPVIAPVSRGLRLLALAGDGAANNIHRRQATADPVVQVLDSQGGPLAGAVIMFSLPDRGPSGSFANGSRLLTVLTDRQGMATGKGLTPNSVEGTMPIQITASYEGQTARRTITQTNFALQRRGVSGAKIGLFSAIAAGAAVGIVKVLEGRSSGPDLIRGTATVGTPTVGAP